MEQAKFYGRGVSLSLAARALLLYVIQNEENGFVTLGDFVCEKIDVSKPTYYKARNELESKFLLAFVENQMYSLIHQSKPTAGKESNTTNDTEILSQWCFVCKTGTYCITKQSYSQYVSDYSKYFDVDAELLKARNWCIKNPRKRKTANCMERFITNWLNRCIKSNKVSINNKKVIREKRAKELLG